jgi:two-component system KDP operon response regulator KdpE
MATKSFRVVYAEDDDMVRASIAQIMVEHGLDVHECSNGGEATLLCSVFHPDAVVLDLSMPGMDGCEAARRIREQHPGRTRLIALTGRGSAALKEAALAGFDEFLCKPVSATTLLGALQAAH